VAVAASPFVVVVGCSFTSSSFLSSGFGGATSVVGANGLAGGAVVAPPVGARFILANGLGMVVVAAAGLRLALMILRCFKTSASALWKDPASTCEEREIAQLRRRGTQYLIVILLKVLKKLTSSSSSSS
jgi:hypothetical protein